jgi:Poly(R)-hydroxyalkanoic acid synthase subunit (PHA_synth_III_E)
MFGTGPSAAPDFVQRTLAAFAGQYASLAALFAGPGAAATAGFDALRVPLAGGYQQLFASAALPQPGAASPADPAASARYQAAAQRMAALAAAVAVDAGERLSRALGESGAPPITTLHDLHELWIDCGEAAWAAAAHREEFAVAQAELLAALVGLGAPARPR